MIKRGILFLLVMGVATVVLSGCKPSTKNELNKYKHNQESVQKFKKKYPAFAAQIDGLAQKAAKMMADAKKLTDEEKKAEMMNQANDLFYDSDFFGQLNSYDGRVTRIYELKNKVSGKATMRKYRSYKSTMNSSVDNANKALSDAAAILAAAKPVDDKSAFEEAKKANELLIDAEASLNRANKLGKKKKR